MLNFCFQNQLKYNYEYFCSPACCIDSEIVSSSNIRELLISGDIEKANNFLGDGFSIKSTVVEGKTWKRVGISYR